MKKSVIIAVLGLSAGALSSFGQGAIGFNSYYAGNSGATVVTFGANPTYTQGSLVGSGTSAGIFHADVLYSLAPITETAGNSALNPSWTFSGAGLPSVNNLVTTFLSGSNAGWFNPGVNFVLNGYTSGSVYFEVIGYNGASYATSTIRGHSDSFSSTLATGLIVPGTSPLYGSWTVSAVPEPTTLALAGLGGLASLVALRRKQA